MSLGGFGLNPFQDIGKLASGAVNTFNSAVGYNAPVGLSNLNSTLANTAPAAWTNASQTTTPPKTLGAATINNSGSSPSDVTSGLGSYTGATTQGVNDPGTIAAYNQAIANTQQAVDRLPAQLQSGYGSIDASYQNALNQLLLGKNQANSAYDTSKSQTAKDYVGAKNTIGANAGSTLNGLLRLLGSRGAGGSSAYNIAAPGAVAQAATGQRQDVGNTFGANNQALDTNWGNFLTGYNNQVSSAGNQKDQQRQSLEQNINSNKASLLQSLAQLQAQSSIAQGGTGVAAAQPYLDQANGLLNSLSTYATSPINYQTSAYTAPDLSKYTTSPTTPTYQGQAPTNDYFSPYLGALLGKKQLAGV